MEMNRISPLLCSVAILLMAGISAPYVYAQSAAGSTLMAYKEGVTPEDENADRAACHEWAVTQSRFDPKYVYPAFIAYETESRACVPSYERPCFPQKNSGIGGAYSSADIRRLSDLYDRYLTAGQVCLEAKGYTVKRYTAVR